MAEKLDRAAEVGRADESRSREAAAKRADEGRGVARAKGGAPCASPSTASAYRPPRPLPPRSSGSSEPSLVWPP
eukprot:scaffold55272_cov33-Phaeocystis_antarctica.AAC.2